jgi:TrmH family RNA methyltransferase
MINSLQRCSHNLRNEVRALHTTRDREDRRQFLAEGPHAVSELMSAGIDPVLLVIGDDADEHSITVLHEAVSRGVHVVASGMKDLGLMSTTQAPQALLAVFDYLEESPTLGRRIIALDGVSDPGNVGTIIRSAAWFGCTDVLLGLGSADLYNPKVVRSTAGSVAHVNIRRHCDLAAELQRLDSRQILAAVVSGGEPSYAVGGLSDFVMVVGSEAHGVSSQILQLVNRRITIPSHVGGGESLNASVATAVLLYEFARS